MSVFLLTGSRARPAHDDGATVCLPREEPSWRRWCCPVKCAAQGSWTSSPVTKCRWLFLVSISDISYWTYCPRKEPSFDCNKYSTLVENEGRAWKSKQVLTGKSLRLEPSSPLWGARWIELMFLFNFLRKGICTLLPSRMGSEQSESQGRLVFPLCSRVSELTFKHRWILLLSKGLKEMRKSNSSQRSTRKRWGLVKNFSGGQVLE